MLKPADIYFCVIKDQNEPVIHFHMLTHIFCLAAIGGKILVQVIQSLKQVFNCLQVPSWLKGLQTTLLKVTGGSRTTDSGWELIQSGWG